MKVKGSQELKVERFLAQRRSFSKDIAIVEGLEDNLQPANQQPLTQTNLQPATPWIRIRTEVNDNNSVIIRIYDNGSRMTQEVHKQLFNLFFTNKSVGHGTGLGLSISYQIVVEKHLGKLQYVSAPG